MTNCEQLFQTQMRDPQFVKAYYAALLERIVDEMPATLKQKIINNEPKETLIGLIDSIQQQLDPNVPQESPPTQNPLAVVGQRSSPFLSRTDWEITSEA